MKRQIFMRACAAAFLCVGAVATVWAQAWPSKPIRLISPWTAGGPGDALNRPIMTKLAERLGQPVVIDNRGGAAGVVAAVAVAKSPADGYTLMAGHSGALTILPAVDSALPYDATKDFEPITLVANTALVLMVRSELGISTLPDLVAYAKANPGKLNWGTLGDMSPQHLVGAMLARKAGISMVYVPYKGAAPAVTDLLGGQIDTMMVAGGAAIQLVEAGKVKAVAVSTPKRTGLLPNVPSMTESQPGVELNSWYSIAAPAGTPKDIVARLNRELVAILQQPDMHQQLRAGGFDVETSTPEQLAVKIREEIARWKPIIQDIQSSPPTK